MSPDATEADSLPLPQERADFIGNEAAERRLRHMLDRDALNNGWMLCGPSGIGKATLAYRIARAFLSPDLLTDDGLLSIKEESQTFELIRQNAHPDVLVCERPWDEKGTKQARQITVEVIRQMTSKLQLTPSLGSGRVAIIDKADELNVSAGNALLKILEEPPANVLILLLCDMPGRLLPTLRSRCRTLILKPVEEALIGSFLRADDWADEGDIAGLVDAAQGRPGYALTLAAGDGGRALSLVEDFMSGMTDPPLLDKVMTTLSMRGEEPLWLSFSALLLQFLATEIRAAGSMEGRRRLPEAPVNDMLKIHEQARSLIERGTTLNADKSHMVAVLGHMFRPLVRS